MMTSTNFSPCAFWSTFLSNSLNITTNIKPKIPENYSNQSSSYFLQLTVSGFCCQGFSSLRSLAMKFSLNLLIIAHFSTSINNFKVGLDLISWCIFQILMNPYIPWKLWMKRIQISLPRPLTSLLAKVMIFSKKGQNSRPGAGFFS